MTSLPDQIMRRAQRRGRGSVFTPNDFLDLGARANVDQSLARLVARGKLRKLKRGLYDYPRLSPSLGALSPSADQIAKALVGDAALQAPGPVAANRFGLTTQISAKPVYLTDGPSRRATIGRQTVVLKHVTRLPAPGRTAGSVYQALHWLGADGATDDVILKIKRQLRPSDKRDLAKIVTQAPAWMRSTLRDVAA